MNNFSMDLKLANGNELRDVEITEFSIRYAPTIPAHPEVQPGTLVNPINKALLEALKTTVDAIDPNTWGHDSVLNFARQAILEAEKGSGENLGSPVPKGPDTEVRRDSLLQTLRDIKAECKAFDTMFERSAETALDRIETLVDDVLAKAEGR